MDTLLLTNVVSLINAFLFDARFNAVKFLDEAQRHIRFAGFYIISLGLFGFDEFTAYVCKAHHEFCIVLFIAKITIDIKVPSIVV